MFGFKSLFFFTTTLIAMAAAHEEANDAVSREQNDRKLT